MQNNLRTKLKRVISVTATVLLVLQGFLPSGFMDISPAHAASNTWSFTTPGNYGTDSETTIFDGQATFNMTWDTTTGTGLPASSEIYDLFSPPTSGLVWAVITDGTVYKSINYGDSWNLETMPADFVGHHFVLTDGDVDIDYMVFGVDNISSAGEYSRTDDDGASWNTGNIGDVVLVAGTHDSGDNLTWALEEDGTVQRTPSAGDAWDTEKASGLTSGEDIMWESDNTIWASGSDGSGGAVYFSEDSGVNWSAANLPGSPPNPITTLGLNNGRVYVAGSGYVATISTASDPTVSGNWTDISSNINSGSFTTVGQFLSASNIMFVALQDSAASEPRIYSTLDNGTDWHEHGDPGTGFTSGNNLVRFHTDKRILWGISNNADADTITSKLYETDDSIVALTGITASELTSVDVTYHTNSENNDIPMSIGFGTSETGTWYYWDDDASAWTDSTTDSCTKASDESTLDAHLSTFDNEIGISGTVYLKLYLHAFFSSIPTPDSSYFTIVDSITITYTPASITVSTPNGGEIWDVGSSSTISWTTLGFSTVDLYYSVNSGSDWTLIEAGVENADGSNDYSWQVPNEPTDNAQIKIANGATNDASDADFRIVRPSGGAQQDLTSPSSTVDVLSNYTTTSTIIVGVTADDNVAVSNVDLYYSNGEPDSITLWGNDDSAPFEWAFDTTSELAWGDGTYHFYSCATDFAGNTNCGDKNLPYTEGEPPASEASTIVDTVAPYLLSAAPENLNIQASVEQDIVVDFSETVNVATFAYQFYTTEGEENVAGTTVIWSNSNHQVNIEHPTLKYDTWYTFKIVDAKDAAGNSLTTGSIPLEWYFKTTIKLDPNLTNSTITATTGTNPDGSHNTGDVVGYIITLTNTSDLSSPNTTASLTLNQYLTYQTGSADSSSGTVTLQQQNGQIVGLEWSGAVNQGTDVIITFQAAIDHTVDSFQIQQRVTIADGINPDYTPAPATIRIASAADFSASVITVSKTEAPVGSSLRYEITIKNTGTTIAQTAIFNPLPHEVTYIQKTLKSESDRLVISYNDKLNRVETIAILPIGESISFSYSALIKLGYETGHIITNSATARDITNSGKIFSVQTITRINNKIPLSPELSQLSPPPNATGIALDADINLDFNVELEPSTFQFNVSFKHYGQQNISGWQIRWSNGNTRATLIPPNNLAVGATYVIDITEAQDTAGNILAESTFLNTWTFTTASPSVTISSATKPLTVIEQGKLSNPIVIELVDAITGELYTTPDNLTIKINTTSSTGQVMSGEPTALRPSTKVVIAAGTSATAFYYTNPQPSLPSFDTLTLFETPSLGFPDIQLPIVITDTPIVTTPSDMLEVTFPSTTIEGTDTFSEPLLVKAKDIFGNETQLPEILYFYSDSTTAKFYDGSLNELPTGVQVQNTDSQNNIQYFKSQSPLNSAVFYYRDTTPSSNIIIIADNPLSDRETGYVITAPDPGFRNASAVLDVLESIKSYQKQPATARLANITTVNDNSGRVLDYIKILPTVTQVLPGESKTFYAQGYDSTGRAIENLIFKWYTPSDGGTLDTDNASQVVFTANKTIGTFYDAAMVVAMYNGVIKYATTDVMITDVVEYQQPTTLPVSGWNGLQIIFIILTLTAAVLLAWVEYYDKTHFKPKAK